MPLLFGSSKATIQSNFKQLRKDGFNDKQSWAIAMKHAKKTKTKKREYA